MKEVPVVDIKITDLKKLYQKGYNMLEEYAMKRTLRRQSKDFQ